MAQGGEDIRRYILVIGGLGYVGSHTTLELLIKGFNIIIIDNLSNCHLSTLQRINRLARQHYKRTNQYMPALDFYRLDYCSRDMAVVLDSYQTTMHGNTSVLPTSTSRLRIECDVPVRIRGPSQIIGVVHLAGFKSVPESIDNPLAYYANNVCGIIHLLQLLQERSIFRFVFSSSATVYGTNHSLGEPLHEDLVIHGSERSGATSTSSVTPCLESPYARTKYFSEAILADVATSNSAWSITALRYFNPIGCHPSGLLGECSNSRAANLFPSMVDVLLGQRGHLEIYGRDWPTRDGTAVRDFVHVVDIARGHVAALQIGCKPGFHVYNLGSGSGMTVFEAVKDMELASGRTIPVRWAQRRCGDVGVCIASTQKAKDELKWQPHENVEKCAGDLWNFVLKNVGARVIK